MQGPHLDIQKLSSSIHGSKLFLLNLYYCRAVVLQFRTIQNQYRASLHYQYLPHKNGCLSPLRKNTAFVTRTFRATKCGTGKILQSFYMATRSTSSELVSSKKAVCESDCVVGHRDKVYSVYKNTVVGFL